MRSKQKIGSLLLGTSIILSLTVIAGEPGVGYPEDYRSWRHVKSMLIHEGHALYDTFGGIHHIYANAKAMEGYETGTFPDGAVIAFDLLAVSEQNDTTTEGARKVLGVMEKDRSRFSSTGGWGFEGFAAGDPAKAVVGDAAETACFGCHTAMRDSDYVFSAWRD